MTPFEIDDEGRAAYHAAASMASNFLVTLQAAAETIAAGAGLEPEEARALLAPLCARPSRTSPSWARARRSQDRWRAGTTRRSRPSAQAVEEVAPELLDLFDELVRRTRDLAAQRATA